MDISTLGRFDRKVLVAATGMNGIFDAQGYPTDAATETVTVRLGSDQHDEIALRRTYCGLKFLRSVKLL